jgi:hypothetical protein
MMRANRVDHFAVAAKCRANPGEWVEAGEYNSSRSAAGTVGYITRASVRHDSQKSAYMPAGAFDARQTLTEFGARVEARYVGDSDDAAWADALASVQGGVA